MASAGFLPHRSLFGQISLLSVMSSTILVPLAPARSVGTAASAAAMGVSAWRTTLSGSTRLVTVAASSGPNGTATLVPQGSAAVAEDAQGDGRPGRQLVGDEAVEDLLGDLDATLAPEPVEHAAGGVEDDVDRDVLAGRRGRRRAVGAVGRHHREACPAGAAALARATSGTRGCRRPAAAARWPCGRRRGPCRRARPRTGSDHRRPPPSPA